MILSIVLCICRTFFAATFCYYFEVAVIIIIKIIHKVQTDRKREMIVVLGCIQLQLPGYPDPVLTF